MQKNIISLKKLKVKIFKKEGKNQKKEKKENSTELHKANVVVEVYNNNKKCD